MRVVSTFFRSSSVSASVKCKLDDTDTEYLVVSKQSRLEVFALLPEGARLRCSLEIWGIISSLKIVPHEDRSNTLLVTTETPDPLAMLLEYVPERENREPKLQECGHVSLQSPRSRTMEDFDGAVVHPSGDISVVATYVGKLKALVLEGSRKKTIESDFDCILTELNVLSMCFLPAPTGSTQIYELAILYRDYTETLQLTSHELNVQDRELSMTAAPSFPQIAVPDNDACTLIPVPATDDLPGGVLVLGGRSILYYEMQRRVSTDKGKGKERAARRGSRKSTSSSAGITSIDPSAQVTWPLSDLTACASIDDSRILLGDKFGQLSILSIVRSSSDTSLALMRIGETSPASTITYLNSGVIFVGSHFGDSQILRIIPSPDPLIGVQLDIIDTHKNLAPIMDAVVVDAENSGQAQIVTCSGAHNTGSLKIIRNGAELQELASVENMVHAKLMWPLRQSYDAPTDNILAVSTLQSTHFYTLNNSKLELNELDEDEFAGFSHEATFAVANVASVVLPAGANGGSPQYNDSKHVVQVTCSGVFLINLDSGMRDSVWNTDVDIVAASVNASQIAVALKGRKVVILMVKDAELVELRSRIFDGGEIAAITVQPYDATQPFSNYVAIGFYESNAVGVWSVSDLRRPLLPPITLPHLPVSLLLAQFGLDPANRRRSLGGHTSHPTHLLVGLGDGNMRAISLDIANGTASVTEEKLIALGSTRPVFITPLHSSQDAKSGVQRVLVCGNRPVVLYWESGRLKNSPLVRKGISAACPLNSSGFPLSIVFAAVTERDGKMDSTSLLIGRLRELQKLHVRTIPFGLDNPVRISHHPGLKVLGVGCQRTQPHRVGERPLESASFKIIDDTTYEQLHHFPCELGEEVTIVQVLQLSLDDTGSRQTYLVVGTQFQSEEFEASEGRLLLYEARDPWLPDPNDGSHTRDERDKVALATSFNVKGCVFAVTEIDGRLVAAVNESVYVFGLAKTEISQTLPSSNSSVELKQLTRWTHNYIVSNMVSRGHRLYVGDTISSVSVLEWDEDAKRLQNVARDYASLWPVSIQTLDKDSIIGCDNDTNLFVFNVNATDRRLEQAGNYFLGDCVNKFIPGVLAAQSAEYQSVKPEHMFVTATGQIGIVSDLDKEHSLHMTALQRNLTNSIFGPGDVKHARWRAPKNSRGISDAIGEASGFLDGDLLERFLDYESGSQKVQEVMDGSNAAEKLGIPYSEVMRVLEQLQSLH